MTDFPRTGALLQQAHDRDQIAEADRRRRDEIIAEAREICATVHEDRRTPSSMKWAEFCREGAYDSTLEMRIAIAAVRRGIVIGATK